MVVFTCAHCGDSLQKPKVEKHYDTKCRNNFPDLCCVDCLKDFRGDEFRAHTKCISEAERYGSKGFVPKPSQNKGERKQNAWIEIVQSVLDENKNLSGPLRNLLDRVSKQPNTPRKKPKFINFVKSMDHRTTARDIDEAWSLLSSKLDMLKPGNGGEDNGSKTNGHSKNDNDAQTNDIVMKDNTVEENGKGESKQKKKNKNLENGKENVGNTSYLEESDQIEVNGKENTSSLEESNQIEKPLSKKERKELKKRQKYEAELIQIETAPQDSLEVVDNKKKLKKQKFSQSADEKQTEIVADLLEDEVDKKKKSKKRKLNQPLDENEIVTSTSEDLGTKEEHSNKKVKKDDASSFDWVGVITSVLGSKGKEVALKKLQKKVLTEYCVLNNTQEISERITKKYLKNLNKMENVKIEHDKAWIVLDGEE